MYVDVHLNLFARIYPNKNVLYVCIYIVYTIRLILIVLKPVKHILRYIRQKRGKRRVEYVSGLQYLPTCSEHLQKACF